MSNTGYLNVHKSHSATKPYVVIATIKGKTARFGYYATFEEALLVADRLPPPDYISRNRRRRNPKTGQFEKS